MNTKEQIGEELKRLRELKGLTQDELGQLVKKSRKTIHAYEKGYISITLETLQDLLDVFGVSVGKFLDDLE